MRSKDVYSKLNFWLRLCEKAKVLERDLESFESQDDDFIVQNLTVIQKHSTSISTDKFVNSVDDSNVNARKELIPNSHQRVD